MAIALLALVMRLIYIRQITHAPFADLRFGDAETYHRWALQIAGGNWLGDGVFYQAPLYPYFLAVVYKLFGQGAPMVRFIQAVIGTGACVLLAAAGMALFGRWGVVAGALLAVYPSAIFLDGLLDKAPLVTFLTVALLYLLADGSGQWQAALAGLVLGLLSLTRENALLLAVPVLVWFVTRDRRRPRLAAAFLAGCALVLLPVGARNYAVGGEFHLTTSQFGPNFYIGNHAGARGLYDALVSGHGSSADEREDATRLAEEASGRTLSPNEVSSFWTARAFEFIRAHPAAWLGQLARKLALTFNAVELADTESQEVYAEWSPVLRVLAPFSFGVLVCLAAFGVCMTAPAWRRLWFLHAIVLTYTLSIILFYVFARYRFPLVPVLMLFAAGGLAAWREPSARRMRRWAFVAACIAAALTYLPMEGTRTDRIVHYVNIANTFSKDSAKWDQAVFFYQKALDESPRSPAAHLGIGTLLAQMGRPQDAIVHYRTAVAGWPDNADLRLNLAVALRNIGDTPRALDELQTAARLRPGDPTPHAIAGRLLLEDGRPEEAVKALEQAVSINPNDQEVRGQLERAKQSIGGARK